MDTAELYSILVDEVKENTSNKIKLGIVLSTLKENDNWKRAVGEGVSTWNAFLKQPEIGISMAEANKLIKIHDKLIVGLGYRPTELEDISIKNLFKLVSLDNITDEIVEQARTLSDKDFKEVLAENQNITSRTYTYQVMKKCIETGNMTKVHDLSSELIKDTFNLDD